jgi:hypothetical protein
MYQLGLEFLRLHDGKFNYPPGHTVNFFFFQNKIRRKINFFHLV